MSGYSLSPWTLFAILATTFSVLGICEHCPAQGWPGALWGHIDNPPPPPPEDPPPSGFEEGDPIEIVSGLFSHEETDCFLPGLGMSLKLTRKYSAARVKSSGPFGPGWEHSYHQFYELDSSDRLHSAQATGRLHEFPQTQSAQTPWTYRNSTGLQPEVVELDPGDTKTATRKSSDNLTHYYQEVRTTAAGTEILALIRVADEYGNEVNLTYDQDGKLLQVQGTSGGAFLQFTYVTVAQGTERIQSVQDHLGRTWVYAYDPQGLLESTTDPSGAITTYDYDANNNLTHLLPPGASDPPFINEYDSSRRVIKQYTGPSSAGQRPFYTFSYELQHVVLGEYNEVVDPLGRVRRYYVDVENGKKVIRSKQVFSDQQPTIPITEAVYEYDDNLNITTITYPDFIVEEFTYDASNPDPLRQSDLLVERLVPNDGGMEHRTEHTYEGYRPKSYRDPNTCAENDANGTSMDTYGITYYYDSEGKLYRKEKDWRAVTLPNDPSPTQTARETWEYNGSGQIVEYTDARGTVTEYEYADQWGYGLLTKVTSDAGGINAIELFTYDAAGNVVTHSDAEGHTTTYQVDILSNRVQEVQTPTEHKFLFYDQDGTLLRQEIDDDSPWGDGKAVTEWDYDQYGYGTIVEIRKDLTSTQHLTIQYEYDALLRRTDQYEISGPVFDPNQDRHVSRQYDHQGLVVQKTTYAANQDSPDLVETYLYDNRGRLLSESIGSWTKSIRTYDGYGRLNRITDTDGAYLEYAYDPSGNVIGETKSDGTNTLSQALYTFDERDRLRQVDSLYEDELGNTVGDGLVTTLYSRDENGMVVREEPEGRLLIEREFDALGRLLKQGDDTDSPSVSLTTYTYDDSGAVLSKTKLLVSEDPSTHSDITAVTSYTRGVGGRPDETHSELGTTSIEYNSRGKIKRRTSPEGVVQERYYDEANNVLLEVLVSTPNVTSGDWADDVRLETAYDTLGRVVSTTRYDSSLGSETISLQYDAAGRIVKEVSQEGTPDEKTLREYTYDDRGNIETHLDANGTLTSYLYGPRNERISASITPGTGVEGPSSETWDFDAAGRLIGATAEAAGDYGVDVVRLYNSLGSIEEETLSIDLPGTASQTYSTSMTFDDSGRFKKALYDSGTGSKHIYDSLGRVDELREVGLGAIIEFDYLGASRQMRRKMDHSESLFTFGTHGKLNSVLHETEGPNSIGNPMCLPGCPCPPPQSTPRILATSSTAYTGDGHVSYVDRGHYDTEGNRILTDDHCKGDVLGYDEIGRLTEVYEDVPSGSLGHLNPLNPPQSYRRMVEIRHEERGVRKERLHDGVLYEDYQHNAVGALVSLDSLPWSNDEMGSTVEADFGDGAREFKYDHSGRLVETSKDGSTHHFYYDALGRRVGETTQAGSTRHFTYWESALTEVFVVDSGAKALDVSFFYGPGDTIPDAQRQPSDTTQTFLLLDVLGNVACAIQDGSMDPGRIVEQYRLDLFGVPSVWVPQGSTFVEQPSLTSTIGNQFLSRGRWVEADVDPALVGLHGSRSLPSVAHALTAGAGNSLPRDSAIMSTGAASMAARFSSTHLTSPGSAAAVALASTSPLLASVPSPMPEGPVPEMMNRTGSSGAVLGKNPPEPPGEGSKKPPPKDQIPFGIMINDDSDSDSDEESVGEAVEELAEEMRQLWEDLPVEVQQVFKDADDFINAVADALHKSTSEEEFAFNLADTLSLQMPNSAAAMDELLHSADFNLSTVDVFGAAIDLSRVVHGSQADDTSLLKHITGGASFGPASGLAGIGVEVYGFLKKVATDQGSGYDVDDVMMTNAGPEGLDLLRLVLTGTREERENTDGLIKEVNSNFAHPGDAIDPMYWGRAWNKMP